MLWFSRPFPFSCWCALYHDPRRRGEPKIFGLDKLNYEKPIFICEGPLDSLLLENAIAMAGADLSGGFDLDAGVVYVLDNEPRNKAIVDRMGKLIDNGETVVIWPTNIKEKDINDMVLAGIPVQSIIKSNCYKGLTATLKLKDWTKA